jgi:hypothetical protein
MNTETLDFYKNQLKYAGFGLKLYDQLATLLENDTDKIVVIPTKLEFNKGKNEKTVEFELRFQKSATSGKFFLNNFTATLENAKGEKISNTFYLDRAKGVTAKEAFNLLEGRSVYKELKNKEGEAYKAWIKLNPETKDEKGNKAFTLFSEKYGYDLAAAVEKVLASGLYFGYSKEEMLRSLEKGNLVEMHNKDKNKKYLIAADPQFKSILVFNEEGEKQFVNNKEAKDTTQDTAIVAGG